MRAKLKTHRRWGVSIDTRQIAWGARREFID
jgi:hypothetical protein